MRGWVGINVAPVVLVAFTACSEPTERGDGSFTGIGGGALEGGATGLGTSGLATVTGTAGADAGSDAGEVGGVKLDVSAMTAAGDGGMDPPPGEGCEKVDFLFVIDNSGSMGGEQDALLASFPGFMASIQTNLTDAQDYHVMAIDTDAEWGGPCAAFCFGGTCPIIPAYPCDTGPPTICETTLGAGVTWTMATDAPNTQCEFSSGRRYIDKTEPNLVSAFQCSAKAGSDGDNSERPIGAMAAALSADLGAPGNCNEGFVRDDAILVVTIITDEDDITSNGDPPGWFANIVASKAGDATAVVMLGLIVDSALPDPICPAGPGPERLQSFIEMFPNSIIGGVCAPNYNFFFQQAVELIDATCQGFTPPEG